MKQATFDIFPTPDIVLWQGDCLELMPDIADGSIDMVMADPPYGTTACKWDSIIPLEPMWKELKRVIKKNGAIVLTASQPFTTTLISSNMAMFKYCWVWDKGKGTNFMSAQLMPLLKTEDICVFSFSSSNCMSKRKLQYYPQGIIEINKNQINSVSVGGKVAVDRRAIFLNRKEYTQKFTNYPTNIIDIPNDKNSLHPTQKPVALMEYLIKTYTNEGETVLDFCMGSGTTGVACRNLNRNFIGIEKDPEYFDIVRNRIDA